MKLFKKTRGALLSCALIAAMILPLGVRAADESPIPKIMLSVGKGDTPQYTAEAEGQELTLNVDNQGSVDAKNIKVTPVIDDASNWPFEIANMNNEQGIESIAAGETGAVTWGDLKIRSDVGTKSYKLNFVITCDDGVNQYQTTKYVYVKTLEKEVQEPAEEPAPQPEQETADTGGDDVYGGGFSNSDPVITGGGSGSADSASVPRVIVTGFSTDPGDVNAGSNFKLIVHLKNTSSKTGVSNMLFDLQAPSSGTDAAAEAPAFLPSSGSSSIYLDSIPAAYQHGVPWLEQVISYIHDNYLTLKDLIERKYPRAHLADLQGTYLTWLDVSYLEVTERELAERLDAAGLGAETTSQFGLGEDAGLFIRMNIACPKDTLAQGLEALERALDSL